MAVNLSPVGGAAAQFFTNTGAVLTGGKLYTYVAGTTTPEATYTTSAGNIAWTNPIILDAAGRVSGSGEIWLTSGVVYKFVLKDSNDVLIGTYDNVIGINDVFIDASEVTYTPGGAGAVATTVQAKLRQYISVKDFGAVGNGIADDTNAIVLALTYVDSLGGGVVYCPTGNYRTTSQIQVPQFCGIVGDGSLATQFKRDNAGFLFKAGSSTQLTYGIQFKDFGIRLNHPDANGIWLSSTCGADVGNIFLEGYIPSTPITYPRTNIGMYIDTANFSGFFNTFVNVILTHIHVGWKFAASAANQTTCQTMINCTSAGDVQYGDTTSIGIDVQTFFNGSETVWVGGNLEGCATAVKFGPDTGRMTFNSMRFEANTVDIYFGIGAQATTWVGCRDILTIVDNSGDPTVGAQPPASTHQFIGCAVGGTPTANEMFKVLAKQSNAAQTALTVTTEDPFVQPWQSRLANFGTSGSFSGQGIYKQGYNGVYFLASEPNNSFVNKTWAKGDTIWNTSIVTGNTTPAGWRCLTTGTFVSPAPAGTGGIVTIGDVNLIKDIVLSNRLQFVVGQQVTVSAGFPTTGPYYVTKVVNYGSEFTNVQWVYINATANANVTGVTLGTVGTVAGSGGTTDGTDNVIKDVVSGQPFRIGQLVSVSAGFPTTGPFRIENLVTVSPGVQYLYMDVRSNAVATGIAVTVSDPTFIAMANIP
jgi:hypothetical protein